jgi:hypothetical protein
VGSYSPAGCGIWVMRLFILPHMCVGVWLLIQAMLTVGWFFAGNDVAGQVTYGWALPSKKSTAYEVEYRYPDGTTQGRAQASVSRDYYDQLPGPMRLAGGRPTSTPAVPAATLPLRVRVFRVGPLFHVAPLPPVGESIGAQLGFALFAAAFWNGIVSVFAYQFWIKPWRLRFRY